MRWLTAARKKVETMNDRSMAIAILCSHLCVGENVFPLEPKEYNGLASVLASKNLNPEDILSFSKQDFMNQLDLTEEQTVRFLRLLDRSASLGFEISKYESMGISLLTRAEPDYPKKLKKKLKLSKMLKKMLHFLKQNLLKLKPFKLKQD